MKKTKLIVNLFSMFLIVGMFFSFITVPVAAGAGNIGAEFKIPNPTKYGSLEDIINAITSLIRPVFILTFGAMILYGGWVRLTSQGNAEKIQQSSQIIVAAIIGFAIAVFAPTVVDFVGRLIGIQGGLIST